MPRLISRDTAGLFLDRRTGRLRSAVLYPSMLWLVPGAELTDTDRDRMRQLVVARLRHAARRLLLRSDQLRQDGFPEPADATLALAPLAARTAAALDSPSASASAWTYGASLCHQIWGVDGSTITGYRVGADVGHPTAVDAVVTLARRVASGCHGEGPDPRRFPLPVPAYEAVGLIRRMLDSLAPGTPLPWPDTASVE